MEKLANFRSAYSFVMSIVAEPASSSEHGLHRPQLLNDERLALISVVCLALGIRIVWVLLFMHPAAPGPGIEGDELTYVYSAHRFITWFQAGRLVLTPDLQYNDTHPILVRILFALGIYTMGGYLGDMTAARLVSAVGGSIGTIAMYYLGRVLFQKRSTAVALAVSFSFSPVYFGVSTTAVLDGISVAFILIALFFLLNAKLTRTFDENIILSGIFLGLGLASKLLAVIAALVASVYVALDNSVGLSKRLIAIVVLGCVTSVVFLVVQPRMWFDPIKRISETYLLNVRHFELGHPIPLNSLLVGSGIWFGARVAPPWWAMLYWVTVTASPFQLIGIALLIFSVRRIIPELKNMRVKISLLMFAIPLVYLII